MPFAFVRTSTRSARGRPSTRATSRWTARGRCSRAWCGCSSATSTVLWSRARASRRRAGRARSSRSRPTPTTTRRSASIRCRWRASRRGLLDAGKASERDFAEVVSRSRRDAHREPVRAGDRGRLARRAAGGAVLCVAAAQARPAADLRRRRGRDHRARRSGPRALATIRSGSAASTTASSRTTRACATSPTCPGLRMAAKKLASTTSRSTSPSSRSTTAPRRSAPRGARPRPRHARQPLGRSAGRAPGDGHRPHPRDRGGAADRGGRGAARDRPRGERRRPATEPGVRAGRRGVMARCAVVGIGQTKYSKRSADVSLDGLVREAALRALEDAELTLQGHRRDRDRQGARRARGRDDARAVARRRARRGRQADPPRAHRGLGGRLDRDLGRARWSSPACTSGCSWSATRSSPRATRPGRSAAGAPAARARAARSRRGSASTSRARKAPEHIGWKVAVKDRLNALKNPYAHLHLNDISIEKVKRVPDAVGSAALPRVVPVVRRRGGDRARPMQKARSGAAPPGMGHRPRQAHRVRSVPGPRHGEAAGRRRLREGALQEGGHHRPAPRRSTAPSSTCRSRGTSRCGSRATSSAKRARAGSSPTRARPSSAATSRSTCRAACCRRTRSARPGLIRCLEAANQVRGTAGDYQVDGAKVALGHAYGGGAQYFAMWIVSSEPAPTF